MIKKITYTIILCLLLTGCKKDLLHWQKVSEINSFTASRLNHIKFINDSVCIIGGGEKFSRAEVLRSVDRGYTWELDSFPVAGKGLYGLGTTNDGRIYLSGINGEVVYSLNYGKTWQIRQVNPSIYYVGISFPDKNKGLLISTNVQTDGSISVTDSNLNVLKSTAYPFGLNNIIMANTSIGYISGYGGVLKTIDEGQTWSYLTPVGNDNYTGMQVLNENEVWICGYGGSILHTSDGGVSWQRLRNGNDITLASYHLYDIVFKDNLNGWAVGENGKVIHTDDGGHHWMEYDHFTDNALLSIAICPNGDLLTCGENGALFRLSVN
ncbi:MAG: hypothetical protein H0X33_09130 [Taibaiella sp.]|nr:hypothetical protein [Taibaiella sp.]